jgi:hypothetical protein
VHKLNHSYINLKYKMHIGFNHYCSYRVCNTVIRFWENIPRQIFTHGIDLTCIIAEPNLISKLVIIITKWSIHFKAPECMYIILKSCVEVGISSILHIARVCAIRGEALFNDRNKLKLFKICQIDLFLYVGKTDVINICTESHFWSLITYYWQFSSFSRHNIFQTSWNFIQFP